MVIPPVFAAFAAFSGSRWRQHGDRIAWVAIAGSFTMTAASYALLLWQSIFGLHDAAVLATIMRAPDRTLLAFGLLAMIADRSPINDRYLALEAGIVALAVGLVMWVTVVEPALTRSPLDSGGRLLSLSLPASDLVLVALVARLALGYRTRLNRSFVALQLALVARLVSNMMSYWGEVGDRRVPSATTNGIMILSLALFAWAALDRRRAEPTLVAHSALQLSRLRLVSIVLSAVVPQVVLISLLMGRTASHSSLLLAAGVAVVVSMLALMRLWGLAASVRTQSERGGNDRLASLVERSSDVVVLVDVDGRISYTSPALLRLLGYRSLEARARLRGRGLGRPAGRHPRCSGQRRVARRSVDGREATPSGIVVHPRSLCTACGWRSTHDGVVSGQLDIERRGRRDRADAS